MFHPNFQGGYNNQYGSISESNGGMGIHEDGIAYDADNSVFEADNGGHYNNVPNPMISNTAPSNANNPVVMMQVTTPLPQISGQGDGNYNYEAPRAAFDEDEHQRQMRLMQQGIGDQPPIMQRPKMSMSGQQSRGLFSLVQFQPFFNIIFCLGYKLWSHPSISTNFSNSNCHSKHFC